MEKGIQVLLGIVSRKGSSKMLTFGIPHVFKALQMLSESDFVSRADLKREVRLGEGAVKTLIVHLREAGIIGTVRAGNHLTGRGRKMAESILAAMPGECRIRRCSLASGRNNHAIILKGYGGAVRSGIEQRDYAIMYGSDRCVTIAYRSGRLVFPGDGGDCLRGEEDVRDALCRNLKPEDGDVIIISSSNDGFTAEMSAKNSALQTLAAG